MTFRFRSIAKFTPAFQALIDETSRKVFGNLPIVPYRTGFKYLKRKPIGDLVTKHYIDDQTRPFRQYTEDFDTEMEERRREKLDRLKFRGKSPPKKGQGKRASKKK
jgi:small subunit ribosomal protein S33